MPGELYSWVGLKCQPNLCLAERQNMKSATASGVCFQSSAVDAQGGGANESLFDSQLP